MRMILAAGLCALLIVDVAFAQSTATSSEADVLPSQCAVISPAPTIPDGRRATAAQMHAADALYRAWASDTEAKLRCRASEVDAANHQLQASISAYQAQAANARAVSEAYNSAIAAFNARGAQAHEDTAHH
jgi:hypothetical protein